MTATEHDATTVVALPPEDVVELAETLTFIAEWFTDSHDDLATPLRRYTFGLFSVDELADELGRFARHLRRTP